MANKKEIKQVKKHTALKVLLSILGVGVVATGAVFATIGIQNLTKPKTEETEAHTIELVQPAEISDWKISSDRTEAKIGDIVTFTVSSKNSNSTEKPVAIRINKARYDLDENYQAKVEIKFIEKMTVGIMFDTQTDINFVHFNSDQGSSIQPQSVTSGTSAIEPKNPTRDGYVFEGWYLDDKKWDFVNDKVTQDITLTAHWTVEKALSISIKQTPKKVIYIKNEKFDANGLEVEATMANGGTKTLLSTEYKLSAVDTTTIGVKIVTVTYQDKTTEFTVSVKDPDKEYFNVSFNSNGGSSVATQSIESGKYVVEPKNPTQSGKVFAGWFKDKELQTSWNFATDTVSKDTELFAKWNDEVHNVVDIKIKTLPSKIEYVVDETFVSDGLAVQEVLDNQTLQDTTNYTLSTPDMSTVGTKTITVTHKTLTSLKTTFNIYVSEVKKNSVVYMYNYDNKGSYKTELVVNDTLTTAPTAPVRTGFTLTGWYKTPSCAETDKFDFTTTKITQDTVLYAGWQESTISDKLMSITTTQDANIWFEGLDSIAKTGSLQYSKDGHTWLDYTNNLKINLKRTEKLYFKGSYSTGLSLDSSHYVTFYSSAAEEGGAEPHITIGGTAMSLLYGDNPTAEQLATIPNEYCFYCLFLNNTNIISVDTNFFPATTITNGCYSYAFCNCTSLINAPSLPATILPEVCYEGMFKKCKSLLTMPTLSITQLGQRSCYEMFADSNSLTKSTMTLNCTSVPLEGFCRMFANCTSLTNIPTLSCTTIGSKGYSEMFENCISLSSVTLGTDIAQPTSTDTWSHNEMFRGCTGLSTIKTSDINFFNTTGFNGNTCCENMFYGCTGIYVSQNSSSGYTNQLTFLNQLTKFTSIFGLCNWNGESVTDPAGKTLYIK